MHGNTNPSRPAVLNPRPSLDDGHPVEKQISGNPSRPAVLNPRPSSADGHPVEKQISVQRLHLCKHR